LNVSCRWFDPSAFITKISASGTEKAGGVGLVGVSRSLMKASLRPSARQLERPSKASELAVRLSRLPPLGLIVQISMLPSRSLSNAILPFSPGNAPSAGETPAARPPTQMTTRTRGRLGPMRMMPSFRSTGDTGEACADR
jgi:hypothetical protein